MRLLWIIWGWPLCILLFTLAVTLIAFVFPDSGARPAVIMTFLFVIPGMAVVRFFRLEDIAIELMLAIALSFAIDAFTAGIILYAGQWSPKNILSFLIGFCFSGAVAQLALVRPAPTLVHPLALWNVEVEGSEIIIDLAKAPSSRQKAEKTRAIIEMATSLSNKNEDTDITLELVKRPPVKQNEDTDITLELVKRPPVKQNEDTDITLELVKRPPVKQNEDVETTINLKPRQINEDTETTINLKHGQNTEDTETRVALFHQFHQALQEDTEEKTISLDTSELSSKDV
jgi:hypothetical protein